MLILTMTGLWAVLPDWFENTWALTVDWGPGRLTMMEIHGFFAMAALFLFGVVFNSHVSRRYKQRKKRRSGISMLTCMVLMAITGGLLYYAGHPTVRSLSSWLHTVLGCLMGGLAIWHGRRSRLSDQASGRA
ncbi:MAG: hypothetical protein KDC35_12730 [Acidobacteria bacterium]|nr:hypothetical protein [Acidobacteriota bacterium]